jgi:hypothetical protein
MLRTYSHVLPAMEERSATVLDRLLGTSKSAVNGGGSSEVTIPKPLVNKEIKAEAEV